MQSARQCDAPLLPRIIEYLAWQNLSGVARALQYHRQADQRDHRAIVICSRRRHAVFAHRHGKGYVLREGAVLLRASVQRPGISPGRFALGVL